jgi:hypothetical protein
MISEFGADRRMNSKNKIVLDEVDKLGINQYIHLLKEDWHTKTNPNSFVNSAWRKQRSGKHFRVRTLKEEKGWIITRIK